MSTIHERQWQRVRNHHSEHVRRIAERAFREPVLRQYFPYASHHDLHFSGKTDYPFDPLPYICTVETSEQTYELRNAQQDTLVEGDVDHVIAELVPLLATRKDLP